MACFAVSISDPDLLELRDEIALVDTRIAELLGQLQTQETGARRSEAKAVHQRMRDADFDVWDQIEQFITLRARLVQTESRRQKDLQQMIPVDRVWALVAALVQSVRTHVRDGDTLARIQRDFRELTGRTEADQKPGS